MLTSLLFAGIYYYFTFNARFTDVSCIPILTDTPCTYTYTYLTGG